MFRSLAARARRHVLPLACGAWLAGCGEWRPGPLTVTEHVLELDGAGGAALAIDMPGGELSVGGGARAGLLLAARLGFDQPAMEPSVQRERAAAGGADGVVLDAVRIAVPDYRPKLGRTYNTWEVLLGAAPVDLGLEMKAGRATFDLGATAVRRLDLVLGAGELLLDLAGCAPDGAVSGRIEVGHGSARLRLPRHLGLRVRALNPVGTRIVEGLAAAPPGAGDEDTFENARFAAGGAVIDLVVRVGVGEVVVEVVDAADGAAPPAQAGAEREDG